MTMQPPSLARLRTKVGKKKKRILIIRCFADIHVLQKVTGMKFIL